jgi:hypothetical protein
MSAWLREHLASVPLPPEYCESGSRHDAVVVLREMSRDGTASWWASTLGETVHRIRHICVHLGVETQDELQQEAA